LDSGIEKLIHGGPKTVESSKFEKEFVDIDDDDDEGTKKDIKPPTDEKV
jgi:hypothetical protein